MEKRHIYIDDSGNLHNTHILVIVCIIFANEKNISITISYITDFILNRFKSKNTELHFNKESIQTKTVFFKRIQRCAFTIKYYKADRRDIDLSLEDHIIRSILMHKDIYTGAKVFIDGNSTGNNKSSAVIQRIKSKLREHDLHIKSLRFEDSKRNVLIQLADMCAGCIRRKLERNTIDDRRLFDMIRKFIQK